MDDLTIKDVCNFQKYCLKEHDLPVSLKYCRTALLNFDNNEDRINFLKRLGVPAFHFEDGRSWNEYMKENLLEHCEWLKD